MIKDIQVIGVSIQLISPASGNLVNSISDKTQDVSIQLISPASGNFKYYVILRVKFISFHSINIPSEWEYLA
jgi:hypothetical protein